ncbi:hypothetical protein EVJ58_g9778, partial [Rhodofomes roseus]
MDALLAQLGVFLYQNQTSLPHILVYLAQNAAHPMAISLHQYLPTVLDTFLQSPSANALREWAANTTACVYRTEVSNLSQSGDLHFVANAATPEKLETFTIRQLAVTMQKHAPTLWRLFDVLLNADSELTKLRERRRAKRKAVSADNPAKRRAVTDPEDADLDDEEDVYWAEFDVFEELLLCDEETRSSYGAPVPGRPTEAGVRTPRSKPESLRTVRIVALFSIVAKSSNQQSNAFPSIVGVFEHACNTPDRVIEMLSQLGLSISPSSINNAVSSLARKAEIKRRQVGQELLTAYAYDNFDVAFNVRTPTVDGGDRSLAHLTSATMIPLAHGVEKEDLKVSDELWSKSRFNLKRKPEESNDEHTSGFDDLRLLDLHPDDSVHPSGLNRRQCYQSWNFVKDLIEHGPSYFEKFRDEHAAHPPEVVEQIPLTKTQQYPLRAMNINESTNQGNIQAIQD